MATKLIPANDPESSIAIIEGIRKRVNADKMLKEPFFAYIKKNRLTKADHKTFFTQYYTIVKTSYRMLAAGILSTPAEDTDTIEHLVRFLETDELLLVERQPGQAGGAGRA